MIDLDEIKLQYKDLKPPLYLEEQFRLLKDPYFEEWEIEILFCKILMELLLNNPYSYNVIKLVAFFLNTCEGVFKDEDILKYVGKALSSSRNTSLGYEDSKTGDRSPWFSEGYEVYGMNEVTNITRLLENFQIIFSSY